MVQAFLDTFNGKIEPYNPNHSKKDFLKVQKDFESVLNNKNKTKDPHNKILKIVNDIGDVKDANVDKLREYSDLLNEATQEAAVEAVVDMDLAEEETDTLDTEVLDETSELTDITDEDSTMESKLTPSESQALAIMLAQELTVNHSLDKGKIENDKAIDDAEISFNTESLRRTFKNMISEIKSGIEKTAAAKSENTAETTGSTLADIIDEEILQELNVESVEAGMTGEGSLGGDMLQGQNMQELGIRTAIQGDISYSEIQSQASSSSKAVFDISPSKIIEQITKQLEGMYNGSKVNIVLNPESLGRIAMQILNSKEGLSAQFTVSNQEIRDILMKGLDNLKENLIAHGINVDSVVIKVGEDANIGDNEQKFEWGEGSRGGNKDDGARRNKDDKKHFEQTMLEFEQNGKV